MSDTVLVATTGRPTGSAASRRLRAQDLIPAVVYGHGAAPLSVTVGRRDLRLAVSGPAGMNTVLTLEVDGDSFAALIKDVQRHPVKRTVSHVDFLRVNLDEQITVQVPLHLTGEAKAVLDAGGVVDPAVNSIEVTTTVKRMPTEIVVDVSDLQPGGSIRLADVKLPAGCTATGDPEMAIVIAMGSSQVEAPAEEISEPEVIGEE